MFSFTFTTRTCQTVGTLLPGQFWDLVEVASASGKFKTLIKIIKDLGLVQPLRGILHLHAHILWLFI